MLELGDSWILSALLFSLHCSFEQTYVCMYDSWYHKPKSTEVFIVPQCVQSVFVKYEVDHSTSLTKFRCLSKKKRDQIFKV